MQDRVIQFVSTQKRHYEVLDLSPSWFVALTILPGSRVVVGKLPMRGYAVIERPRAGVRAGSIVLEGLTLKDAEARVGRANAGMGLDRHHWS